MNHTATGPDIINIPIRGGITEGGLIIIMITVAIIALIVFVMFILIRYGRRFSAWLAEIRADTAETKESTVNSHGPNLRDDLDQKVAALQKNMNAKHDEMQRNMDAKHSELREDIRALFTNMGDRFDTANRRMDGIDARLNRQPAER